MPAFIKRLTPAGLFAADYSAADLATAAAHEPLPGVYTVGRTFNRTQTLLFEAHLDRLADSAQRENIPLVCQRRELKAALRQMVIAAGFGDVRFRLTVPAAAPDEIIISLEPFQPPPAALLQNGAACITSAASQRQNPAAKTSGWMRARQKLQRAMPPGIYETILLDADGHLLEGLTSNFYAVLDGQLRTAADGVLAGIAQRIVFEICPPIVPLHKAPVHQSEIPQLREAFLTSSSRGIIPITAIDDQRIDSGAVGKTTQALQQAYQRWLNAHLEEL